MPKTSLLTVILHIAGWTLFLSLPILFIAAQSSTHSAWSILISVDALVFSLTFLTIFYFHTYYLFPKLYLRKKLLTYTAALAACFLVVWLLRPFDRMIRRALNVTQQQMEPRPGENFDHGFNGPGSRTPGLPSMRPEPDNGFGNHAPPPQRHRHSIDMVSFFLFVVTLAFSLSLGFRQKAREAEQKALEATADKTRAELFFLKAQIHPHFLFNTLNNIYSLAVRNDPNTSSAILKLSNILRYTTDEAPNNFVPLESEVEFLHDYVDLQRMRLADKMNIDLSVSGLLNNKQIAPLLLMTFVENAFKYGVSNHEASLIRICLEALHGKIHFTCENNLFSTPRNAERTGIGIANTQKRLDQLYAGRHSLNIQTENGKYTVDLTLPDQA